ncbi:hypothetical protein PMAYCL1PPCAC_21598, partial [Pristionchus mayeri]
NSFGTLTLSQAIVDSIHQFFMAFYFAPTLFFRITSSYAISRHFGYVMLSAYQICCYSHLFISINRFFAVCAPVSYKMLFSASITRRVIIVCWLLGFIHNTILDKILGCPVYLPEGGWFFIFDEVTCGVTMWYGDFLINSINVIVVATLDISSVLRLHCMSVNKNDKFSVERRRAQKNLVYQAALQGICFLTELITYFILSG